MSLFQPDRILLGHNPFFGVDHMSSERGAERERLFADVRRALDVIRYARGEGAGGMMMSTHPRAALIADAIREDVDLRENFNIYILLPYMAKYVRAANEKGAVNVVLDTLSMASWKERVRLVKHGAIGLLKQDQATLLKAMIDAELLPFKGLSVRAVFLHNALSDMVSALHLDGVLRLFHEYVREKHGAEPAFCTLSFPLLMERLSAAGIEDPLVMAPFNAAGYQMNPSRAACEAALRARGSRVIAMSTLAAGFLKPSEAFAYTASLPEVRSVIVGASTREHIKETFEAIRASHGWSRDA